jgi:hypothetical protein
MEALDFSLQAEALLQNLTVEVLNSIKIEDELLPTEQVRSSLARRLRIPIAAASAYSDFRSATSYLRC